MYRIAVIQGRHFERSGLQADAGTPSGASPNPRGRRTVWVAQNPTVQAVNRSCTSLRNWTVKCAPTAFTGQAMRDGVCLDAILKTNHKGL
jgi:hypothetical protein